MGRGDGPHAAAGSAGSPIPAADTGALSHAWSAVPQQTNLQVDRGRFWAALLALLVPLATLAATSVAGPAAAADPPLVAPGQVPLPLEGKAFEQRVLQVLKDHPEAVFEALQRQLRKIEQQKSQRREAALAQLQRNPAELIGRSPTLGQGSVRLIVFSDFQCPYCATAARSLAEFLAKNGSKLSLTYKFYPLVQIHPEALPAARAAWAAEQQGRFWPFHDALFAAQERLGEPLYRETARQLGLDLRRFDADRKGPRSLEEIERDRALGDRLGLEGTPYFVVNGEAFSGAIDGAFLQKLVEGR